MTAPAELKPFIDLAGRLNEQAMQSERREMYCARMRKGFPAIVEVNSFPVICSLDAADLERISQRYLGTPAFEAKPTRRGR